MKINLFSLIFLVIFVACEGQSESQTQTTDPVSQQENSAPSIAGTLAKQEACSAIPLATIASLMDVDESSINQEDMSFGEDRSICYFYTKEGNRKFFIRMTWKNEKAQENKVLQTQFTNYLANGEEAIKEYEEVQNTEQAQVLFGIGQDRERKYIHILRKRYGNKAEVQLELTKESKDEMAKSSLMTVLEGLT